MRFKLTNTTFQRMKHIQATSRMTDVRVLFLVTFPAIGFFLLMAVTERFTSEVGMEIVVVYPVALLVWSVFRLIEPRRYSENWTVAEFTVVPVGWLLLMLAYGLGCVM